MRYIKKLGHLALLALTILVASHLIMSVFLWANRSAGSGELLKITDAKRTKPSVIIIGNSRAQTHYDPLLMQQITGKTFYNMGQRKTGVLVHCSQVDLVLKEHSPEVILYDICADHFNPMFFAKNWNSPLFVYYQNSTVKERLKHIDDYYTIKSILRSYHINQHGIEVLYDRFLNKKHFGTNGFEGLNGSNIQELIKSRSVKEDLIDEEDLTNLSTDTSQREYLKNEFLGLVRTCELKGIRLVLLTSPYYKDLNPPKIYVGPLSEELKTIVDRHNLEYYRITSDSLDVFKDPSLFYNSYHMNKAGAAIYSEIVARRVFGKLDDKVPRDKAVNDD